MIAYGIDGGCILTPGVCDPVCFGDPCPGQVSANGFLVLYKTTGGNNPPTGGFFQTLCPWPGNPSPRPASVLAVDWDPYTQQAFVLTVTPNGPGFGEVWRTDLATYTIKTPITPPQPTACNPNQPFYFTDLAVYRNPNTGRTLVAVAMNTFFGGGATGNVDVFDSVTGASVISVGPYCRTNLSYRRIDAGYIQYPVVPGMFTPGYYVAVMPRFTPFFSSNYFSDFLLVPPTSNTWLLPASGQWSCPGGPEILRPLSISINPEIPSSCGLPMTEVVIGGLQECSGLSAPAHSYAAQNLASPFAQLILRHAAGTSGFDQLATDVVVTAGQTAPAPMYAIQYGYHTCNSPAGKLWWLQRECNAGNPVALPDLPLTNVQPVDVAAIR